MKIKFTTPTAPQWMLLISIAGVVLSLFMWRNALVQHVIGCLTGGGCEVVLRSQYSKIFGVPIAAYGVAFYGFSAIISLFRMLDDRPLLRLVSWKLSGIGILASAYFIYLEVVPIKAFCSWCTVSTFLTIGFLIVSLLEVKKFGGFNSAVAEAKKILWP